VFYDFKLPERFQRKNSRSKLWIKKKTSIFLIFIVMLLKKKNYNKNLSSFKNFNFNKTNIKGSALTKIKKYLKQLKFKYYKKGYGTLENYKKYNFNTLNFNNIKNLFRKKNKINFFVFLKRKIQRFIRNKYNLKRKIILYKNKYNLFKF
jgi:hypothetical protein